MTKFIKFELKRLDFVYILNGLMWTLLYVTGFASPDPKYNMISVSIGMLIMFYVSHRGLTIIDKALKPKVYLL